MPRTKTPEGIADLGHCYIGFDNGVTGTIARLFVVNGEVVRYDFQKTPVYKEVNYQVCGTKKITRIRVPVVMGILKDAAAVVGPQRVFVGIENPLTSIARIIAMLSSQRAHEATLIATEYAGVRDHVQFVPAVRWQKQLLPAGCKGDALKEASMEWAIDKYPDFETLYRKHKDADGMAIAHYIKRQHERKKAL